MVFEIGSGSGSGSGSTRLIFRSLSEILKNTPPVLSENLLVFRPQPTNPEELKRIHANKEMEKMKDDKLKYEEKLVQEFMPPKSFNDTETEGRAKASIDVTEKMNKCQSTAHLWSIPIEYDQNYAAPNLEQGSGLFMGGSAGAFVPFKKPHGVVIKDTNEESGDVTRVEHIDHVKDVKRGAATPRPPKRQRRCWTPELHDLFVNALSTIGGPEVATPKHILEHMQVEGLTADEVKSHLQKFRIHIRKIAAAKLAETLGEENGGEYSEED